MNHLAWCSCGWSVQLTIDAEAELRMWMPVMVDHWSQGHSVRCPGNMTRVVGRSAQHYHREMGRGTARAAYEEAARRNFLRLKLDPTRRAT